MFGKVDIDHTNAEIGYDIQRAAHLLARFQNDLVRNCNTPVRQISVQIRQTSHLRVPEDAQTAASVHELLQNTQLRF